VWAEVYQDNDQQGDLLEQDLNCRLLFYLLLLFLLISDVDANSK
jgi:hypothetical protein